MSLTGIGEAASAIKGIVDKFFPDKSEEAKNALSLQIAVMQQDTAMAQMQADVNKAEAGSQSLFVAGWRPFVGWVCGAGFGVTILGPLLSWIAALAGHPVTFPSLDTESLMTLLLGMLGLGGMRTAEKLKGVSNGH